MPVLRTLVVPGLPHADNRNALDWGWEGLIAYGCQSVVVVIDPRTVQPLQTLAHHKSTVTRLRWSHHRRHHTLASPYSLHLASVDSSSLCVIWDVGQAAVVAEFSLGNKPLVDMQWLSSDDTGQELLAVMLSPSTLTLWNSSSGSKVTRVTFSETIEAFTFSPFHPESLVLQSPECFIFVSDFNANRMPTTGGGKKLYMTKSTGANNTLPTSHNKSATPSWRLLSSDHLKGAQHPLFSMFTQHRIVAASRGEDSITQVDCRQILFSPAHKHHLLIVYPREVVVMDMEIRQAVGSLTLERNTSPLLRLLPCRQRNTLFCLHENGSVSMRFHQTTSLPSSLPTTSLEPHVQVPSVSYTLCCSSEPLRISKLCTVFSGALCLSSEKRVAVMTSEGRILIWDVEFEQVGLYGQEFPEDVTPPTFLSSCPVEAGLVDLPGEGEEGTAAGEPTERLTLADTIAPHWFTPPEGCLSSYAYLSGRMVLNGMWCGMNGRTTALRMCPPLTTKNWIYYVPQVAVGTTSGMVYVVSLKAEAVVQEVAVHTCPVRGIEWLSHHSFVSWAHTATSSVSVPIRNEICVTDIQTGRVTPLSRGDSETTPQTPIETVRVSSHKNYLVAKYKDKPLEFWDAKSLTFMRELVSNPPTFSCVEWYPTHGKSKTHKVDADNLMPVDFDLAMGAGEVKVHQEREVLNVMDDVGSLWQISIEGSRVRVINGTPLALPLSGPCGMSFKGDLMVSADAEGNIVFLENSQWKSLETHRGVIKKLRFAPGKGNYKLLVLYHNRMETRDTRSHSSKNTPQKAITMLLSDAVLGSLKWGSKDSNCHFSVEDADWATSDKPVVLGSDGCLRVFDTELRSCTSVLNILEMGEPVFLPQVVLPQASLRVKAMLQHQPWNLEYSLDPNEVDDMDSIEKGVKKLLTILPESFRQALTESNLGTPSRALITARLYGDQREVEFWSVAQYYLLREKCRLADPRYQVYKQAGPNQPVSDIIRPNSMASTSLARSPSGPSPLGGRRVDDIFGPLGDSSGADTPSPLSPGPSPLFPSSTPPPLPSSSSLSPREVAAMLQETLLRTLSLTPPLDLCHDLLTDADTYQRVQLYRAILHDGKRQTYDQTRRCAETLLLLNQTDRAVHLLLETDSSSRDYYTDALKACLAATIRSSGASQSTIKLVATNLIANSRIMDGVQLLCLIDKGLDGCRYLQTYGEWRTAAWLARATLSEKDCGEVFTKWADHLASVTVNNKEKALLVLLSLGNFVKIIEMLYGMRFFDQAAVFTEACLEYGVLPRNKETSAVVEAVFLEYARYLQSLGLYRGMRHYCGRAGDKGKKLLEQYNSTSSSSSSSGLKTYTEPT